MCILQVHVHVARPCPVVACGTYRELVDHLGEHALVDVAQLEQKRGLVPLHLGLARLFCKTGQIHT